ncbi:MAG: hypothetical protein JSW27_20730 [Phycisphaerales bacterium]|nr:MAG: hypothetical protein JSW27_20730 [Phycisphaerales bacterium]
MRRLHLILLTAGLAVGFAGPPAWACRYNVLEVGFIDLEIEPYRLFGCVTSQMAPESVSTLRGEIETALVETNVRFELVDVDRDSDHAALAYLAQHGIEELPAAVLVSPDGQSLPIALSDPSVSPGQVISATLVSNARLEILSKVAECYGIILVIEGPDETANALARDAAQAAADQVTAQMEFMPKPIAKGPQVVTLEFESVASEKVLLWSLGAEPADINEPHAAILYGRGRWIGPLFRGEQITKENLERVLFVIGADCECGLDHRWLQGTMLPARWGAERQATVAKTLGFDPESPMVKMEMLSIVRRGMGGAAVPGIPFGYREIEVSDQPADATEIIGEAPEAAEATPHEAVPKIPESAVPVRQSEMPSVPIDVVEPSSPLPVVAWALGLVSVGVVAAGIIVVLAAKRR